MERTFLSPEARSPLDPYRRRIRNVYPVSMTIGCEMWAITVHCPYCLRNHKHGGLYIPENPHFGEHIADCRRGVYIINPPK